MANGSKTNAPQAIRRDEVYPKAVFLKIVGWGEHAWGTACLNGLRTIEAGRRKFVRGADFDAYLLTLSGQQPTPGDALF